MAIDPGAWNREFETLNSIPSQLKVNQDAQQTYYQKLMSDNQAAGGTFYKAPTLAGSNPVGSYTPPTGLMTPPTSSTAPALDTFESIEAWKYPGQTSTPSPITSSAPPAGSTWAAREATHGTADGTSLSEVANAARNTPTNQIATNFTGQEPHGTGTGPNGTYSFEDQARDRYGAANTNEWSANMANAPPDLGASSPWANLQTAQEEIDRRLALRGLLPQTGGATGPGGTSGAAPGLMSGQNTVASVDGKVGYEARQLSDPTKWNVDDNQTVAGQVRNLINENNPLQQQAETRALQRQNANGTLNSSMAVQAGQAAMYDAALPIAQADAATYGRSAAYNADTQNQFAGKNVDASNTAYNATANIRAATARDTAATIAQANLADKQGNISAQAAANLAGVNATTAAKLGETNSATAAQLARTNTSAAVLKAQNDISVAASAALSQQDLTRLQGNISRSRIGEEQTINMSRDLTATINQINMNKDLDAAGKTAQIQKAYEQANNTFEAIYRISQLTGNMLQFEEDAPAIAPGTPPVVTAPPNNPPGWSGGTTQVGTTGLMANGNGGWTGG